MNFSYGFPFINMKVSFWIHHSPSSYFLPPSSIYGFHKFSENGLFPQNLSPKSWSFSFPKAIGLQSLSLFSQPKLETFNNPSNISILQSFPFLQKLNCIYHVCWLLWDILIDLWCFNFMWSVLYYFRYYNKIYRIKIISNLYYFIVLIVK